MDVREADLPGVGKKFAIRTAEGDRLTVIIHNTGAREIYNFRSGEDFPFYAIRLQDHEARKLSAILGGAYFQPTATAPVEMLLEQLAIEWLKVMPGSRLDGRSIGEMEIRKRTGASVIAILREGRMIPNPQPDEVLRAGDTLVVAGSREQVDRLLAFERAER